MDAELAALEEKITEFTQFCQRLREENMRLRQQLAGARNEHKELGEKVKNAQAKLEGLLKQIPDTSS
ncbi:MAG: hypothetical protein ACREUA_01585 [Burkholderiales bacterium]